MSMTFFQDFIFQKTVTVGFIMAELFKK